MRDDTIKSHGAYLNHESDKCVAAFSALITVRAMPMRVQLPHIGHCRVILAAMFRRYKVAVPASRRRGAIPTPS
jgi:hypothetical protein